ncbi:MAG: hypothetical protein Q9201_007324, partial [Fulgogasparrea decipioides]
MDNLSFSLSSHRKSRSPQGGFTIFNDEEEVLHDKLLEVAAQPAAASKLADAYLEHVSRHTVSLPSGIRSDPASKQGEEEEQGWRERECIAFCYACGYVWRKERDRVLNDLVAREAELSKILREEKGGIVEAGAMTKKKKKRTRSVLAPLRIAELSGDPRRFGYSTNQQPPPPDLSPSQIIDLITTYVNFDREVGLENWNANPL